MNEFHEANHLPLNILLTEDNEADIKITLRAFGNAKLKNNIYVVKNGQECLDFIFHEGGYQDAQKYPRPDLVILDINMPKLDGFGVLKNLKANKEYSSIPVVILSASKSEEDVAQCYRHGANSFVQKPVAYEEFVLFIDGLNYYWQVMNKLPGRK